MAKKPNSTVTPPPAPVEKPEVVEVATDSTVIETPVVEEAPKETPVVVTPESAVVEAPEAPKEDKKEEVKPTVRKKNKTIIT